MANLVASVSRTRRSTSSLSLAVFLLVLLLLFATVARSAKITFIRKNGKTYVIKTGGDDWDDDDDDLEETDGEDDPKREGADSAEAGTPGGSKKAKKDSDEPKRGEAIKAVKSPESAAAAAEAAAAAALAAMADDPLVEKYKQEPLDPGSWRTAVEMPLADVRRRAEQGDAEALWALGVKRLVGAGGRGGVARDIPKALLLLERSAEKGFPHAHSALGFLHASGYGVPLNQVGEREDMEGGYSRGEKKTQRCRGGGGEREAGGGREEESKMEHDTLSTPLLPIPSNPSQILLIPSPSLPTPLYNSPSLPVKAFLHHTFAASGGSVHSKMALAFSHLRAYVKAFLHHTFAANGGSVHSKMALAFSHLRQQEFERAAALYADVAAKSMAVNSLPGQAPLIETVHLSAGGEESLEATRGHRGEADETIQFIELQASRGAVEAIRTLGTLYYWGARGMPRDHVRAFGLMKKAAEMDDPHAMLTLGEMLTHGVGCKANPVEAMVWFNKAYARGLVSALNGVGYLHAKGLGVPQDYHKAVQNFLTAARKTRDVDALYNLGMSHLRGQGVRRNPSKALQFLQQAVEGQHVGAMYQMGKMHLTGTGVPKNVVMAARLLKAVAERGPWGVMLRWAHACFMSSTQGPSLWSLSRSASSSSPFSLSFSFSLSSPLSPPSLRSSSSSSSPSAWPASCDVGTSLMLYSRAAELGYEVAQGNAAWLLDKVVGDSVLDNACVGAPRSTATSTATSSSSASSASPEAVQKDREATDGVASDENNAVGGEGSASGGEGSRGAEAGATGGEPSQGDELEGGGVVQGEGGRAEEQQEQNEQKGQKEQQERSKDSVTSGRRGWRRCSEAERHERSHRLWQLAAEQGSVQAALLLGDAFFYGRGQPRDLQRAAEAYWRAREKGSAHAMFNLGFMHEHGMGLPRDLHLAKRFYDQVLDAFPRAVVPVRIALFGLWLRMQYGHYPLVIALFGLWLRMQYGHYPLVSKALDVLPEIGPATAGALKAALRDDTNPYIAPPRLPFPLQPPSSQSKALDVLPEIGPATAGALKAALRDDTNAYIASLLALLLAVLFLRSQRRQQRVVQA
ncbi:unnamed protein product [Closterium sp. Naga37s-1]|nr:unnamed protein product [Closterium sp. Naga37s-1]